MLVEYCGCGWTDFLHFLEANHLKLSPFFFHFPVFCLLKKPRDLTVTPATEEMEGWSAQPPQLTTNGKAILRGTRHGTQLGQCECQCDGHESICRSHFFYSDCHDWDGALYFVYSLCVAGLYSKMMDSGHISEFPTYILLR